MKNLFSVISSFLFLVLLFGGCKKAAENLFDAQIQNMAKQNALAQAAFDDVLKVTENIMMNNADAKIEATGAPLGCITGIDTVVLSATSKKYTITFDPTCTSYDGKARRGILHVVLNGASYNTTGAFVEVTFEDFHIDNCHIQGKLTALNEGSNAFKVTVSDAASTGGYASVYVYDIGKTTYWKSTHIRVLYEGSSDMIVINNKYKIQAVDGSYISEGITTDNKYYSGEINSDYVLDYSCIASGKLRYPTSGKVKLSLVGQSRFLDYGDLTCDAQVSMNWSGSSTTFSLY